MEIELKLLVEINMNIVDPFNIKLIENGGPVHKMMYLKFNEGKRLLNIKWRGRVDGHECVGCVLTNTSDYGTNGTFAAQQLFTCDDGKGVLIPIDELNRSCERGIHKDIIKNGGISRLWRDLVRFIIQDCICCVEWMEHCKQLPKLKIGSSIKCKSASISGTCKWIGLVNGKEAVGVKMDTGVKGSNGRFSGMDLFTCEIGKGALFTVDDVIHDIDTEKLYFTADKIVDKNKITNVKPMKHKNEKGIRIGVPVMISLEMNNFIGEVKWMGTINRNKCVGLDMEDKLPHGMNGIIYENNRFECLKGHGLITPLKNVILYEEATKPHFLVNGIINPNKYLTCVEDWNESFLEQRKVKKNDIVFVIFKNESDEIRMKGTLRWCGSMNQMIVVAVELTRDFEEGTNGRFWRNQLFKCPDKRAIATSWNNIYKYSPYEKKDIPIEDRIFKELNINSAVKYYQGIGDRVRDLYGTIRWTGIDEDGRYLYGLELDDRLPDGTDGEFKGKRLFNCRPGHGILAPIDCINKDLRFVESDIPPEDVPTSKQSSDKICSILSKLVEGPYKGIQGNTNSCYFDSALFALFSTSDVLDFMISPIINDVEINPITKEFRDIISMKIVYPLREFGFVTFHRTNEMRNVIQNYGPKYAEMTKQETDMENVSSLLAKLCPDEQLLRFTSLNKNKNKSMFLQLFLILERKVEFMTSEQMLKVSMVQNDIMFDESPTCLIMQAPRDAIGINSYKYVLPSNSIEISQICSNYFRACFECAQEARYQCKKCIEKESLNTLSSYRCYSHKCEHNESIQIPDFPIKSRSKVFMELKAIICIEKCHFVAYVKQVELKSNYESVKEKENIWYFFDSMSTQSIANNYAIPKVTISERVSHFLSLSEKQMKYQTKTFDNPDIKRIVKDSYIFVYHNPAKTCY